MVVLDESPEWGLVAPADIQRAFLTALDASPQWIVVIHRDGSKSFENPAVSDAVGYSPE